MKGAVRTLLSDLRAARSEAITLGLSGSVTVTISSASSGAVWSYSIAGTVTNKASRQPVAQVAVAVIAAPQAVVRAAQARARARAAKPDEN